MTYIKRFIVNTVEQKLNNYIVVKIYFHIMSCMITPKILDFLFINNSTKLKKECNKIRIYY